MTSTRPSPSKSSAIVPPATSRVPNPVDAATSMKRGIRISERKISGFSRNSAGTSCGYVPSSMYERFSSQRTSRSSGCEVRYSLKIAAAFFAPSCFA